MPELTSSNRLGRYMPTIYGGETIFSFVQRVVLSQGAQWNAETARLLFGSSSLQLVSPFPSILPQLAELSGLSGGKWINEHTVLSIYKPFVSGRLYDHARAALMSGNSDSVFKILSLVANRQCHCGELYYCPQCVSKDERDFKFAYWHVHHQLPGVYSCPLHEIALLTMRVTRKRFDWWPKATQTEHFFVDEKVQKLTRFAYGVFDAPDEYIFSQTLKELYVAALRKQGYVTTGGRLKMAQLRKSLINYWSPLLHYPDIASVFNEQRNPLYPACLFYQEHANHSPLKHLLIWAFLFESLKDAQLLDQNSPDLQIGRATKPVATKSNHHEIAEILEELKQGKSLRQVAANYTHSVAYIKKLAVQNKIHFDSRAQRLFSPECREIVIKLMAGHSVFSISKTFSCSMGAIEQILSQHPYIVHLRKLRRYFDKRQKMRSSLLATKDCLQKPRRQIIKKTNNRAYMWLFKNDKDWLYSKLPDATPRNQRRVR